VLKEHKVFKVLKEHKVSRAHKEFRVLKVEMVILVVLPLITPLIPQPRQEILE
jgi:hypothetical protein